MVEKLQKCWIFHDLLKFSTNMKKKSYGSKGISTYSSYISSVYRRVNVAITFQFFLLRCWRQTRFKILENIELQWKLYVSTFLQATMSQETETMTMRYSLFNNLITVWDRHHGVCPAIQIHRVGRLAGSRAHMPKFQEIFHKSIFIGEIRA